MGLKNKKVMAVALAAALVCGLTGYAVTKNNAGTKASAAISGAQVENLDRGVVAVKTSSGVLVSWRLLGTESYSTTFNVYRNGTKIANVSDSTNYLDTSGSTSSSYYITSVSNSKEVTKSTTASVWSNNYKDIPINKPAGGTTPDGVSYTYTANDASVADLDGDGEYEIVLKWDPTNSKDNSQSGYTGNVYLDAYEFDGTQMWRIDLGCNIRAGAHYTQFMVYDLNGDGKAEVACKTAYGTIDGTGEYSKYSANGNNTKDYRNSSGYILSGYEYLSVFEGKTGDTITTITYEPERGTVSSWGDSYGNRVDRFLACIAYLNGKTPSLVMCRGYYTRAVLVAYDFDGSSLTKKWTYDTGSSTSGTSTAYGQGAHSVSVADVDNDGKDEIIYGSAVINEDGTLLYSTGHGHGDALHVSDFDNDGTQEIFMVHETAAYYKTWGAELREGSNGTILASVGATADVGRGVMANVSSANKGAEFWSSASSYLYSANGTNLGSKPSSCNFVLFWDADLESELLDGTTISKYNGSSTSTIQSLSGVHSNNSTKSTPCLSADILGDWREEVLMAGSDDTYLRLFTTNIVTTNKLYTLMHDIQYREAIAWQNVAYNQPPHTSYYTGSDMGSVKQPSVYTVGSISTLTNISDSTTTTTAAATATPTTAAATTTAASSSTSESYAHNFTTDGKTSSFYSITGNLSTAKGTVTYNGLTLTQCLKIESSTSITFTTTKSSTLTLVFNADNSSDIKVDGTKYTYTNGILTLSLSAGSHTISKASVANLYYMNVAY